MPGQAFVTVATRDEYAVGGAVLGQSLRRTCTSRDLVILVTDDVSLYCRKLLSDVYDHVYLTTELCSYDDVTLSLLGRPDLGTTFTKVHCWRLTQYSKCVFLDADTLVLQPCDELFEHDELSAVPDTGWPDCFNSGVFVFRPSLETYAKLVSLATSRGSFDGGDQGLLNTYFGNWCNDMSKRLPFLYNVVATKAYTYAPAYKHYANEVKIVHFLGSEKPWSVSWTTAAGNVHMQPEHPFDLSVPCMQRWISLFREEILPKLPNIAQEAAESQAETTVILLLDRIRDGAIRRQEAPPQWQQADSLVQEYFPVHVHHHIQSSPFQPPVQLAHYEPQPSPHQPREEFHSHWDHHQDNSWQEPEKHADHHQDHSWKEPERHEDHSWQESGRHEGHHQDHEWQEPQKHEDHHQDHGWQEPERHEDHHSQYQTSEQSHPAYQKPEDLHWEAPNRHEEHQSVPVYEQMVDPHWEALLWHQVQSPWEPPSPPKIDHYPTMTDQLPADPKDLTFGWFGTQASEQPAKPPSTIIDYLVSSHSIQPSSPHEESLEQMDNKEDFDVASSISLPPEETEEESLMRMKSWEEGHIDYMGRDNFDNIWKRLESMFITKDVEGEPLESEEVEEASEVVEEESVSYISLRKEFETESVGANGTNLAESTVSSEAVLPYPEGDLTGMFDWQEGRIDYCGKDRSDNIMKRLDLIFSGKLVLQT